MERDLKQVRHEKELHHRRTEALKADFEKMMHFIKKHRGPVSSDSIKKIWGYMSGKEKPSKATLDKIALFAGFQCWADFQQALHGENDAELNYEDEERR